MKRKKPLIGILVIFILFCLIMPVYASSVDLTTQISREEVYTGEEIELTLKLESYEKIEKGLNAYKATIAYDEEVFEPLTETSFISKNKWESLQYNPQNKEFIAIKKAGSNSPEEIVTIKLKVKENIKGQETVVAIKDFVTSEGKEDIEGKTIVESQVHIIEESSQLPEKPEVPGQSGEEKPGENQKPNLPEEKPEKLPAAGLVTNVWILIAIIILLIVAIMVKRKEQKVNAIIKKQQKRMKMLGIIFAVGIFMTQLIGVVRAIGNKGELNGDGIVDYADVTLLESHLISLKKIKEERLENADMNSDRYLTVTDLSLLIQKVEKKLDYQAEITKVEISNYYPQKGEEITLRIDANINYDAQMEKITIAGKEYPVTKEDNTYVVTIKAPETAGIQVLDFSQITLDVGQTVKIKHTEKIDVLKQVPSLANYTLEENAVDSTLSIKFDVIDPDNSKKTGLVTVIDSDNKQIKEQEIVTGKNELTFKAAEEMNYTINIKIGYDLDTNELIEKEEDHSGTLVKEETAKLVIDYELDLSNIKTYNANQEEKDIFAKQEEIKLSFYSENAIGLDVQSIMVGGKQYEVTKLKENQYEVLLPGFSEAGEKEITITEIILINGKHIAITEGNRITISIAKEKPIIENAEIVEEENKLSIQMQLKDNDTALHNASIVVTNEKDEILLQEEMSVGAYKSVIDTTGKMTKQYHIKVLATYNLLNTPEENQVIYEETIAAKPNVKIEEATVSEKYVEKNASFKIQYKVATNQEEPITKVRVNNQEIEARKLANNTYEIELQAPNTAGEQTLKTTKFYIGEKEIKVDKENIVEVLKTPLTVEGYQAYDNLEKGTVTIHFTIQDSDDTFMNGKVQLVRNSDGEIEQEEVISQIGEKEMEIPVVEMREYTLKIITQYGRDIAKQEKVEEKTLVEKPIQFIRDYELIIEDIKTAKEDGTNSSYFEKGETIKLSFASSNQTKFYPEYVVMNGERYSLEKDKNRYTLELKAPMTAGVVSLQIEKVFMNNTKELMIEKDNTVSIEVLKEEPKIENFVYEKTSKDMLQMTFDLIDSENALETAKIKIQNDKGQTLKEETIQKEKNTVEIALTTSEKYVASIFATYDLDTNTLDQNSNRYMEKEIFKQNMIASKDVIELKEISKIAVFHKENASTEEIEFLDLENGIPTDLDNYYVKIEMEQLPTFYANIKEIRKDNDTNKVFVVIDQTEFIQYQENDEGFDRKNEFSFEMPYKDQTGEHPIIKKANELLEEMASDLSGTYELTEDLDASMIDSSKAAIAGTFRGTLDGNGHKIINLPTVLFEKLNQATIKNLVIENANINREVKGILAGTIENQTIVENTHIKDSKISNNQAGLGAFAGGLTNSTIKNSSAIQISVKGNNTIGGIVGQMSSGSSVENCYVTGTLQGTQTGNVLGARVGGITGWHSGKTIDHCYTNVTIIAAVVTGNGGIIGGPSGGSPSITNSLSMSTGKAYKIAGFNVLSNASNVYEYTESDATTNINDNNKDKIKTITNLYEETFYKDILGLEEEIWNLELVEDKKLPNLKLDPMPNELADYEVTENKNQIPNYEEVRKNANYRANKEILYYNVAKMMPFADTARWVEYANSISKPELITTQKIKFILPLNKENELVVGIQEKDANTIKKIRVIYENEEMQEFTVEYSKVMDQLVAIYQVKEINLQYQFGRYLANIDATLKQQVVSLAKGYDYATVIAETTPEQESRLYVDYYNESVKPRIEEIIVNFLMTQEEYPTYSKNAILQGQITNAMIQKENLTKLLYAYNYYDKWYHIDLDGVKISDLLFFNGTDINQNMTTEYLIQSLYQVAQDRRATNNTHTFYSNVLQPQIGKGMTDFLAYLMKVVNGYDNPSDWFVDHFDGILQEQEPYGGSSQINYRIWDILKNLGSRTNIILPILTAPQEDMYIISMPSQFVIGSMNRYSTYLQKDGKERDRMKELILGYSEKIGHFYGTSADLMQNSTTQLNSFVHIQYDTRFNFPASSKVDSGTQTAGTTRDPVLKWVYEAVGQWGAANGAGAYANGTNVFWIVYEALGGDFSFFVFSHETAHNQDGRYFYGGSGRRSGSGPEAHADGNIAQQIGDGSMVFNLFREYDITENITNNFTYERINTPEKIKSYYKEMFETGYVLDYLVGQAFLSLTPEEQARVAVQASHTQDGKSFSTTYSRLTAEDFRNMNLQTMEDLWDNKICLRDTGTAGSAAYGQYKYESFYCVNWYQPHNDEGTPDSNSFKRLGQEMLGIGGYENGYAVYMSGRSQNDLDALRKITGDDTITWKEYKLNRYDTVKRNLYQIPYFDSNEVIKQFEAALKEDSANNNLNQSTNVKRLLYGIVKRATNDFQDGNVYRKPQEISITTAEQLIELANQNEIGNYRLDADIDFTGMEPEEGNCYIMNRFIGVLNGNNHKIIGLKYPLFNNMTYAQAKDLTIWQPEYVGGAEAFLAITSNNVTIDTIKIEDTNLELPLIKTKTNLYYEYGKNEYTIKENEIKTLEDFLKIGASEEARKKRYILTADIDFASIVAQAQPILQVTFTGKINGNGYTISNLNAVLFQGLNNATIENLKIENGTISGSYAKGALANIIQNSTVHKVYLEGITIISNGQNGVGGLAGAIQNSSITEVSLENINVKANNTIGGLAGQINGSKIENCLVTGVIEGTERTNALGARIGGITGWFSGTSINQCYTKVEIKSSRIVGNGGIIGGPNSGNCNIKNSISLSTGENSYRIAGFNTLGIAENVYEFASSNSTTNRNDSNQDRIKQATEEEVKDRLFYRTKLGWSEEIWNFDFLASGEGPKLRQKIIAKF